MNLSSILNGIIATIAETDSKAMSKYEIDSKKELEMLGSFLNGESELSNTGYTIDKLNDEEKKLLKQMYDNLKESVGNTDTTLSSDNWFKLYNPHEYGKKEYLDAIQSINKDNLFSLDTDMITNMFNNNLTSDKEKQKNFKYISQLYIDKAIEMKLNENEINNFKKTIKKAKTVEEYSDITRELRNFVSFEGRKKYETNKELEKIKNNTVKSNDENELQRYAEEYWYENKGKIKKSSNTFGLNHSSADGDLYNYQGPTTQKTGNCWLMGGLNSMKTNPRSREYINSQVYKDSIHNLYVVQLPEAKNKGLGKDGKGIYIITDNELWKTANISSGDFDIAAYNLAIKKYFEESGEHSNEKDNLDGNYIERFYEISTGTKAQEFHDENIPSGVGIYKCSTKDDNGNIQRKNNEELTKLYDSLIEHFNNDGEITLGIYTDMSGHSLHAVSVVEIKDGKFIIQESNNDENYAKRFNNYWQDENGIWNILLDKEKFIEIFHSVATKKS